MKFGYARISTDDQYPGLQIDALRQAGCEERFIYVDEGKSGATLTRVPNRSTGRNNLLQTAIRHCQRGQGLHQGNRDQVGGLVDGSRVAPV